LVRDKGSGFSAFAAIEKEAPGRGGSLSSGFA
jgi:hypothetical protein